MSTVAQRLLTDLPASQERAIIELGRRALELTKSTSTSEDVEIYTVLMAFISRYQISVRTDALTFTNHTEGVKILCRRIANFADEIAERETKELIDRELDAYDLSASRETFGFSKLTEDEKKKIHDRLRKIGEIVGSSSLSDRKKNALYQRIAGLSKEVDLHGTSTDRFFAFAGDIAFVAGDMARKAKPLIQEVKEVLKIVSRARAREEGVSLPPGDEAVLLPPPEADADGDGGQDATVVEEGADK